MLPPTGLPATADVVIIGGGILGAATAWHLTRRGTNRVVLLERQSLVSGNTSLAAGLMTRVRTSRALADAVTQTWDDLAVLDDAAGERRALRRTGLVQLAASPASRAILDQMRRAADDLGLPAEPVSVPALRQSIPWLVLTDLSEAVCFPEDGFVDPYLLAGAYAGAARRQGVTMVADCGVQAIELQSGRVAGVSTASGTIRTPVTVVAAGVWSNVLLQPLGLAVPMAPVRSHYWLTVPHPMFGPGQPVVVIPDAHAFLRAEGRQLLFGLREAHSRVVRPDALPKRMLEMRFAEDPHGWGTLESQMDGLLRFAPGLADLEIAHYIAGLSAYTPDGMPVAGGFTEVDGLYALAGTGTGIAAAGGLGALLADQVVSGTPASAGHPFSPGRFGPIDPFDPAFQARCGQARSQKVSG